MFWTERFLAARLSRENIPAHIAIIMDGNGRWATKRGLPRLAGHRQGVKAIRRTVEVCLKIGVRYLTLYSFSLENWLRPEEEVSGLMDLFEEMLEKETPELNKQEVRLVPLGRVDELRPSTRDMFHRAASATAANEKLTMILAVNYSGRCEIADAAQRLVDQGESLPEDMRSRADAFSKFMYLPDVPDPDLIIRTSGEMRLSNFLLWEAAYSEFWVTRKLWPDVGGSDIYRAVLDYQSRDRRFGGL